MNNHKFQVGLATVVLLVALRVGLGYHFLYEGVWKITHKSEFTAEPFLTQAKGPISPLFYAMLDDIDGRQRLKILEEKDEKSKKVKRWIDSSAIAARWEAMSKELVERYGAGSDEAGKKRLADEAKQTFATYRTALDNYFADNFDEIKTYFGALDRFQNDPERSLKAPLQKERRWNKMQALRGEVRVWLASVEKMDEEYKAALWDTLDEKQKAAGAPSASWNPLKWSRIEQINFAVTYALSAIGLCLVVGFCTRLAALGGAGFMLFVVMTQPAWPTIYPHDPPVVGHALLVNKDFIEMLALLTIATTAVGRWGGLDYFLYHCCGRRILARWEKN